MGYRLVDQGFESWQGLRIFLFTSMSRPALEPTFIKWVAGALSLGHLVLRSRMYGAIPPLPNMLS
jgi:hypothetical protein